MPTNEFPLRGCSNSRLSLAKWVRNVVSFWTTGPLLVNPYLAWSNLAQSASTSVISRHANFVIMALFILSPSRFDYTMYPHWLNGCYVLSPMSPRHRLLLTYPTPCAPEKATFAIACGRRPPRLTLTSLKQCVQRGTKTLSSNLRVCYALVGAAEHDLYHHGLGE